MQHSKTVRIKMMWFWSINHTLINLMRPQLYEIMSTITWTTSDRMFEPGFLYLSTAPTEVNNYLFLKWDTFVWYWYHFQATQLQVVLPSYKWATMSTLVHNKPS